MSESGAYVTEKGATSGMPAAGGRSCWLPSESARATACLVLDVHLGGMSGFDLQQHLVRAGTPIPTVFITAHDDAATRQRAQSGAAYLRKPFREAALIGAIRQALELPEA